MKTPLLVLLLFLSLAIKGQDVNKEINKECLRILKEAEKLALAKQEGNYKIAINKYNAAKICDDQLTQRANEGILRVFDLIEEEKKQAIRERIRADKQTEIAQQQTRTVLANDLANKAQTLIKGGDRAKGFQLAAFAYRYLDKDNNLVNQTIHDAYYYNAVLAPWDSKSQKCWYRNFIGHDGLVRACLLYTSDAADE